MFAILDYDSGTSILGYKVVWTLSTKTDDRQVQDFFSQEFGDFSVMVRTIRKSLTFSIKPKPKFAQAYLILTSTTRFITGGYLGSKSQPNGSHILAICVPVEDIDRIGSKCEIVILLSNIAETGDIGRQVLEHLVVPGPNFSGFITGRGPLKMRYKLERYSDEAVRSRASGPHTASLSPRASSSSSSSASSSSLLQSLVTGGSESTPISPQADGQQPHVPLIHFEEYVEWPLSAWELGLEDEDQVPEEENQAQEQGKEPEEEEGPEDSVSPGVDGILLRHPAGLSEHAKDGARIVAALLLLLPSFEKEFMSEDNLVTKYFGAYKHGTPLPAKFDLLRSTLLKPAVMKHRGRYSFKLQRDVNLDDVLFIPAIRDKLKNIGKYHKKKFALDVRVQLEPDEIVCQGVVKFTTTPL